MSNKLLPPLEWTTQKRLVKDLVPYEFNPRILNEDKKQKLIESIQKFNLAEIPAINTDNKIIAGHQRVKVLMLLGRGDEEIDVRVPDRELTEEEFKQYNITSNIPTGFWDLDILEEHFAEINLEDLGLDLDNISFPSSEIVEELFPEEEGDFNPEPPEESISEPGDVYELISPQKELKHIITCNDSTVATSYGRILGQEEVDIIITDPPYNVDYTGGPSQIRDKIENDKMSDNSFYNFLYEAFSQAFAHSKPGAPIYVFHADTEGINFRTAFINAGFKLSQCLIWKKNSLVMSRQDYHWIHEPCLYGWKLGSAHPWHTDRKQTTVLEFDRPSRSEEHPTMKPVPMLIYLIKNSS